jgi:hypothetical protein
VRDLLEVLEVVAGPLLDTEDGSTVTVPDALPDGYYLIGMGPT